MTDSERIAALEARIAVVEKRVGIRHPEAVTTRPDPLHGERGEST